MVRTGSVSHSILLAFAAGLVVSGCQLGTPGTGTAPAVQSAPSEAATATSSSPANRVIERDVEAPNVFQRDETGLWDGRPSLGGVWVAHPSARDPERVLIRNAATGQSVIGALFRRERENPGPRFQVSSEAANALGILAGAPTEISVTALRLERIEMEIDPEPAPTVATAAEETLPTEVAAAPEQPAQPATPDAAPEGQVEITQAEPAPRRSFFDRFRRNRSTEPEIAETTLAPAAGAATAAAGAATATAAATAANATVQPGHAQEQPRRRRSLRDLFRRRAPEPEATPDTTQIELPDTMIAAAPPAATQPAASQLDRPYIQIGIFSVEQNAINSRAQMRSAGLNADIRRGRVGENQFWRVVVGPASTSAERRTILQRVRGLGFADAYAVRR